MTTTPSAFHPDARFLWTDPHGQGRNRHAFFRRSFVLDEVPNAATLSLFADTRYRLIVNGKTRGHGPCRFFAAHPDFDVYDLTAELHPGENIIAVIVHSYGVGSFHSEPSVGGLIADLAIEQAGQAKHIVTDTAWQAMDAAAYRCDTHTMSFALNAAEHLDLSQMPDGWDAPGFDASAWPAAVLHEKPQHWGPLRARSIPMLDESPIEPGNSGAPVAAWAASLRSDEKIYSLGAPAAEPKAFRATHSVAVWTHIHSPKAQRIRLGAWWGQYWLNGVALESVGKDEPSLRQDFDADLREGWNTLLVFEPSSKDWWDFYLAVPRGCGLELRATPDLETTDTFLLGGPWLTAEAAAYAAVLPWPDLESLPEALGPWRSVGGNADWPVRDRAWKSFRAIDVKQAWASQVGEASLVLLFDFEREVLGRVRLDFTAAQGTRVDVGYTERLLDDGRADLHGRYFVDMMERGVAREGRQRWHLFHPRGCRYLEVTITGPVDRFELHGVAVTGATYPVEKVSEFSCSNDKLNRLWHIGREALIACQEDAYLDCPWRERGVYIGDALVEYAVNQASFGDQALMRRTIEMFLQGQGDNGMLRPGAHELIPGDLPDYSSILFQCVRRYVENSGDWGLVEENLDRLVCLVEGLEALRDGDSDLFVAKEHQPYIDIARYRWSVCALNAFMKKAFDDAAWVFAGVKNEAMAARCQRQADRTAEAMRSAFWDASQKVYVDATTEHPEYREPSVHGNALALLYGIATPQQAGPMADWLCAAVADNFGGLAVPDARDGVRVNAYFSFYALGALFQAGRVKEALRFMAESWGPMLDAGAWTTWESFGGDEQGSLCHAWAASPTYYLSSQVLGVTFPDPADTMRVVIDPTPGDLTWAQGVWPHALGPIHVKWTLDAGELKVMAQGPAGVELEVVK